MRMLWATLKRAIAARLRLQSSQDWFISTRAGLILGNVGGKLGLDIRVYGTDSRVYADNVRITLQNILLNRHVMKQQTKETFDLKSELKDILKNSGLPVFVGFQAAQMIVR